MAPKVLIIKLTSMGDLMHAFPALSEAAMHMPGLTFDWVVDQHFSDVPSWHPNVANIHHTNHRIWKKQPWARSTRQAIRTLATTLRHHDYDCVIDLQGNLKSAWVGWLSRHDIVGMDGASVRERPAHWLYQTQVSVAKNQHAIHRQRQIMAKALHYTPSAMSISTQIKRDVFLTPTITCPKHYVVLIQNASWPTKRWPIAHWQALIAHFDQQGMATYLTAGNETEQKQAQYIAGRSKHAKALPLMSLNEMAHVIDGAQCCIGSDTGLAHLAALVDTPGITLYGPTNPAWIGTHGTHQQHLQGTEGLMANITPTQVIDAFETLILTKQTL